MNIPICVNRVGKDLDKMERLISKKYKKIIWFYRMIDQYESGIESFEYDDATPDCDLFVEMTFKKNINVSGVQVGMESYIESRNKPVDVNFFVDGQVLSVHLNSDEI